MSCDTPQARFAVLVSADTEWEAVERYYPNAKLKSYPFGSYMLVDMVRSRGSAPCLILQGGWGKVAAAASTQYVIDRWAPEGIINLGTCGGFNGQVKAGEIILAEQTLIYDIFEQMHDPEIARLHYRTELDLSWLPEKLPLPVRRSILVSADRDLIPGEIEELHRNYGAIAGDWESGAIAFVTARNKVRCMILRGVSDLVSTDSGEAYADENLFSIRAREIMGTLLAALPALIAAFP